MNQLFQNLISNAIKFRRDTPPKVEISYKEKGDKWIFSVKDNGIGIKSEYFDKIFVIFQRLNQKKDYKGTGIGLAVSKKIIERHHGEIWVKSKKGKGSNFYFSLPKR
jgi:light-regulated signal transduction histidine kinase (bacteriophytochrome)